MVEVARLATLATVDWTFQLQHRAEHYTERYGVSPAEMKALILARLKDIEKAKAEERRIEDRAQKATEQKAKKKAKAIADAAKLPRDQRDDRIADLAERSRNADRSGDHSYRCRE
jgi:hypothetical protein